MAASFEGIGSVMFKWGRTKQVEDFATALAREFAERCPPAQAAEAASPARTARAIDDVCNRAAEFQRAEQLGLYRKAQFGTAFKMHLKESGYASEFVESFTRQLLLTMSGSAPAQGEKKAR